MLDGFAAGSREAAAAGTPIRVGALLCAMRQNDRWDEVAELVVRYRDAGVVGFDLAGPEDRLPARPHPGGDRHPRPRRGAPDHPRRRGRRHREHPGRPGRRARRAAGPRRADRRRGRATTARSGPLAQRVLDEQVPLEVAPSSNVQTGAYPSLAAPPGRPAAPAGLRRHPQHRQPADERGLGDQRVRRRRDDVRLDVGRRPDRHRAGAGRARSSPTTSERLLTTSSGRVRALR